VGGATRLEGARLLEILELEIDLAAGARAERARAYDRCLDDMRENAPFGGRTVQRQRHFVLLRTVILRYE